MMKEKINCKSIQRAIASAQPFSPSQLEHVNNCLQCSTLQQRTQQLDHLVMQATANSVPDGFCERFMERLSRDSSVGTETCKPIADNLMAVLAHSRLLRTIAISLGMALGIGQLIQIILGIFFVSMMAAM